MLADFIHFSPSLLRSISPSSRTKGPGTASSPATAHAMKSDGRTHGVPMTSASFNPNLASHPLQLPLPLDQVQLRVSRHKVP